MTRVVGMCCFVVATLLARPAAAQEAETESSPASAVPPLPRYADPGALNRLAVPGLVLGLVGYFANFFTAGMTIITHLEGWPAHTASTDVYIGAYAGTSLIPIAGPFISAGLLYELPISFAAHLVAGVVELIGWGLGIAGVVLSSGPTRADGFFATRWSLFPWSSTTDAGATFVTTL